MGYNAMLFSHRGNEVLMLAIWTNLENMLRSDAKHIRPHTVRFCLYLDRKESGVGWGLG